MRIAAGRVRALLAGGFAVAAGLAAFASAPPASQVAVVPVQSGQVAPTSQAQAPTEPAKGTGILIGQVVDASSKRGIAGATVTVSGGGSAQIVLPTGQIVAGAGGPTPAGDAPRQVLTDSSGRFMFRNLAAGQYSIQALAPPYMMGSFGASRAGGGAQMIELTRDDEKRDGIVVRLWKPATISGTVVDEAGEPVIGVSIRGIRRFATGGRVRLSPLGYASTDDRGVFRLTDLTPGEYFVGVLSAQTTLPVATSDAFTQARYSSGGSITNNDIYRELMSSGLSPMILMGGGNTYRVGDFMFSPTGGQPPPPVGESRVLVYPSQFYPSATVIGQASPITLASGEERTGIDLHLKLVPGMRVSGTVMGPDGPMKNLGLKLMPAGADDFSTESGMEAASAATDANGAFTFLGVTPGQYTLKTLRIPRAVAAGRGGVSSMVEITGPNGLVMGMTTSAGAPTPPAPPPLPVDLTLWATAPVTVGDADVHGVSLTVRAGARLAGRIVFETDKEKPTPAQIQQASIQVTPVVAGVSVTAVPKRVESDGSFATLGYPPGRYLLTAAVPPTSAIQWRFKSAMAGGRDVSDVGLDLSSEDVSGIVITFTDVLGEINGTVTNDRGQNDQGGSVVVLPADSTAWKDGVINTRRIRSTRVSTIGAYRFTGLPPGDYYLAALSTDLPENWQLAASLEAIARVATRVTLADGAKINQALTTKTIR